MLKKTDFSYKAQIAVGRTDFFRPQLFERSNVKISSVQWQLGRVV